MSTSSHTILVTGAAGFIGRHVVRICLEKGFRVIAHQNQTELPLEVRSRCERVVQGDICDVAVQKDAVDGVDIICHLAAYIPAQFDALNDVRKCYRVNAEASLSLAQEALKKGINRFIQLSAGNMYAPADSPRQETDSIFPASYATDYMTSKLAAELYLTNLASRTNMELFILRIGTPYGPGEPTGKVIPTFLRRASNAEVLRLTNGGDALFNFVYIDDICDLILQSLKTECCSGGVFNVGTGQPTSLLDMANTVLEISGCVGASVQVEASSASGFSGFPVLSIKKAIEVFGFSPLTLREGLKKYRTALVDDGTIV